ncbi:glycosyltransferase [Schleiferiaceae bacterium]|jgi:sterol 3beta-glucosyltransferase|nr:glycosyltransferase [Schleiferiaceae bacterium]MDA8769385.1 glycosyltransferase [Schleiferiaceae bacterium]MDA8825017.1 glycosyltransferase [Schleiferiaceae bacterium]MDB2436283.1 glycosyltransferase [Schleiferiaceae bacterium]MDB2597117.1 glycosyltransferase [Schleiferiaceae bacterium]
MDRILLMTLGSRGDMEPYLALGEELKENGYEVGFCMPEQFRSLAAEVSEHFFPMTHEYLDLIDSPDVKKITGQIGSGWSRISTLFKLLRETKPIQEQLIRDQRDADMSFKPDRIIYHIKCAYPVMAALRDGRRVELLIPMPCLVHPVRELPAIGMGQFNNRLWNKMSYALTNSAMISQAIIGYGNKIMKEWNWAPFKRKEVKRFLLSEVPVEYAISKRLFPQPSYWPDHVKVTDFRERNKSKHWKPSEDLARFIEKYPNPLYVGFGSMINAKPKEVGQALLELSNKHNLPIFINSSWGGIEIESPLPENIFLVKDIPYDWLFSRVCAVVHHGGSGTTHSALRFDRPQLILPHIADQFLWNKLINEAGIGPLGFPIKKFTSALFEEKVLELLKY